MKTKTRSSAPLAAGCAALAAATLAFAPAQAQTNYYSVSPVPATSAAGPTPTDYTVAPYWRDYNCYGGATNIGSLDFWGTGAGTAAVCAGWLFYTVIPVELPVLAAGEAPVSADFQLKLFSHDDGAAGANETAQLWSLGIRNDPAPIEADNLAGNPLPAKWAPIDWTGPGWTLLQPDFLVPGRDFSGDVVFTDAAADGTLLAELQGFYAANPGYAGGSYLFLRVNATVFPGTANLPGRIRWDIWSAEANTHATAPAGGAPPVLTIGAEPTAVDGDGDGVVDDQDNCPSDANPGQEDLDGDLVGDACDIDADGDGDPTGTDCDDLDPARYAGAVELCADGIDNNCNGLVDLDDSGGDCDGDGVDNGVDNCVLDYNPGQEDLDGDLAGDACDADDDGDGVGDITDNCPVVANAGQEDYDGDGAGDVCDADGDGDGVDDSVDLCHFTAPADPDDGVPSRGLGKNRWADIDGNGTFDTTGKNPTGRSYDMADTLGCGCAQIIATCGYGNGHTKFGCSNSVMDAWTGKYDYAGGAVGVCK